MVRVVYFCHDFVDTRSVRQTCKSQWKLAVIQSLDRLQLFRFLFGPGTLADSNADIDWIESTLFFQPAAAMHSTIIMICAMMAYYCNRTVHRGDVCGPMWPAATGELGHG